MNQYTTTSDSCRPSDQVHAPYSDDAFQSPRTSDAHLSKQPRARLLPPSPGPPPNRPLPPLPPLSSHHSPPPSRPPPPVPSLPFGLPPSPGPPPSRPLSPIPLEPTARLQRSSDHPASEDKRLDTGPFETRRDPSPASSSSSDAWLPKPRNDPRRQGFYIEDKYPQCAPEPTIGPVVEEQRSPEQHKITPRSTFETTRSSTKDQTTSPLQRSRAISLSKKERIRAEARRQGAQCSAPPLALHPMFRVSNEDGAIISSSATTHQDPPRTLSDPEVTHTVARTSDDQTQRSSAEKKHGFMDRLKKALPDVSGYAPAVPFAPGTVPRPAPASPSKQLVLRGFLHSKEYAQLLCLRAGRSLGPAELAERIEQHISVFSRLSLSSQELVVRAVEVLEGCKGVWRQRCERKAWEKVERVALGRKTVQEFRMEVEDKAEKAGVVLLEKAKGRIEGAEMWVGDMAEVLEIVVGRRKEGGERADEVEERKDRLRFWK